MAAKHESPAVVFDRTPPQSIDAERAVLASMLINPDTVGTAIEVLGDSPEETFYVAAHQHVYEAIVDLFRKNTPVDATTLTETLSRSGQLEAAGGVSYLSELLGAVATSANIEYYAKMVLETALLRRLIGACTRITGDAYKGEGEVEELLDRAESDIFSIAEQRQVNPIYAVKDLLEDGIHRIEEQMKSRTGITGIATGFEELDGMLSGFQNSDMVVLAARPSVGKTAFALNVAAHAANELGKGVLLFSLEMAKEQLVQRLLCMVGRVDSDRLRKGFLARAEFPKLQEAAAKLSQANLYIDESANISVLELRSKARRHAAQHPVDMIIIDYLQLMRGSSSRSESRQVEISEISRSIKGIARELRVPVIALSQLSREAEKDDSGSPKLSHLRESGAIEQDADVVMMLSRPPAHEAEGRENVINLVIAKQRNGPTGKVELLFQKNIQRFVALGAEDPSGYTPAAASSAFDADDYDEKYEEDDIPFDDENDAPF
jgi:replicative DNA helicase